jgi:transcriptional regulator with XRE-family HTH domain
MKKPYDEDNLAKLFMPAVLRRYRDAAGLSQQQLADSVGIAKSYISSLELGYRAPHLNLLVKIAQALGVRPGELLDAMVEEAEKNIQRKTPRRIFRL